MSNQVFSGALPRYFPNVAQSDVFTFIKSNPGPPAFGRLSGSLNTVGAPLYWDRLNGSGCTLTAGKYNYQDFQSPLTKPYYLLTSSTFIQNRCTLLQAITDNVIQVEVIAPMSHTDTGVIKEIMVNCVLLDGINNEDYANAKVVCMAAKRITGTPSAVSPNATVSTIAFSGTVSVQAGQLLGVYVSKTTEAADGAFVVQDTSNGQPQLFIEAMCSFTKL